MQTLHFEIVIDAPRSRVWERMLAPDGYQDWTAAFAEGSRYEGSWEPGASIRFLGPSGDGMLAEIVEHVPHEFVSIRHIGMIVAGVEDTTSEQVRAWTPAFENYRFVDTPDGCRVIVSLDTATDYLDYMRETYPKALERLKLLCER
jgi:uncharacterized protein YndB with AHSA1/START domain